MKLDFPNHLSRNDLQEILARSSSAVVEEKVSELKDLITHEKKLLKELHKAKEAQEILLDKIIEEMQEQIYNKLGHRPEGVLASLDGSKERWDVGEKKIRNQFQVSIDKEYDELERLDSLFQPSEYKIMMLERNLKPLMNILAHKRKKERFARLSSYEGKTRQTGQTIIQKIRNEAEEFFLCPYCMEQSKKIYSHVDHIYPVSKGGLSVETNMVLVCSSCNLKKKDSTLYNFSKLYKLDFEEIVSQLELLGKVV